MRIRLIRLLAALFCVTACSVGLAGEPAAEQGGLTGIVRNEAGMPGAAPPLGPRGVNLSGGWPLVRASPDAAMTLTFIAEK